MASKWIIISEGKSRLKIPKNYFAEEYQILLDELHNKVNNSSLSYAPDEKLELERRREKIVENKIQIIKDLDRTFYESKNFGKDSEGRKQLMNLLEVISLKYTDIGYVQGMNFVAAAIINHASPAVSLGIFSHLIENLLLCDIYAENLVGVTYHNGILIKLVGKHLPELNKHLEFHEINLEMFFTSWIIDLFSHIIPLNEYWAFLNNFLTHKWDFFYRLILTILQKMQSIILEMDDWGEILEEIKDYVSKVKWKKLIVDANYKFLNLYE